MRVLLLTDNHYLTGGAENYFFALKDRLKNTAGITVFSMGFADTEILGDDYATFPSRRSNWGKFIGKFFIYPRILRKLNTSIKKFNPDVIHLHNVRQYTATVFRAIQAYPVVQTTHDFNLLCPTAQNIHTDLSPCTTGISHRCYFKHKLRHHSIITYLGLCLAHWQLRRLTKKQVRYFLAPSPLLLSYLVKHQFEPVLQIMPFCNISQLPAQNESTHFLFAGSLAPHKGVGALITEFALACQQHPQLHLFIAGKGPQTKAIQNAIFHYGIQRHVTLLGWQTDLTPYYQQCNALIFPSIGLESFGLVITEAMSHARPIIAVNRGTAAWLVENQANGLLYQPNILGDLSEKILTFANDKTLANTLGKNGYQKLMSIIDNEGSLRQILKIYQSVIISKK